MLPAARVLVAVFLAQTTGTSPVHANEVDENGQPLATCRVPIDRFVLFAPCLRVSPHSHCRQVRDREPGDHTGKHWSSRNDCDALEKKFLGDLASNPASHAVQIDLVCWVLSQRNGMAKTRAQFTASLTLSMYDLQMRPCKHHVRIC